MAESYMTYDEWINAIFDHPVTETEWYYAKPDNYALWDLHYHYPEVAVGYITRTFEEIAKLPKLFSDRQIADGLNYIVNPSLSDIIWTVIDLGTNVSFEDRLSCIESIYVVYEQLFSIRCSSQIAASEQPKEVRNPLNLICFMWWDVFPQVEHPAQITSEPLTEAIFNVMTRTLALNSEACQEAALHGLGEFHFKHPMRVLSLVNKFLAENTHIRPELRTYAEKASWGAIP